MGSGVRVPDYEICADEAWTHGGDPPNRYWCFFGGLFGPEPDLDRLESRLNKVVARHGNRREVKWKNVSDPTEALYKELVDELLESLRLLRLKYRQVFLDRMFVYVPPQGTPTAAGIDVQFRIYYQFLKHAFGIQYLPPLPLDPYRITLRLD